MRRFLLIFFVIFAAMLVNISAQPPGTNIGNPDANIGEDSLKMRSVELERIKRDAAKNDPATFGAVSLNIGKKFSQIKEDFESIQISESAIVNAYKMSKTIDYKLIESSAKDISKKCKRLDENLFAYRIEDDEHNSGQPKNKIAARSFKDLIIDLDTALGEFVASNIFKDHKIIDPKVAQKTRTDLANILAASEMLAKEAGKMKQK
jgi:hypothetical protein